MRWFQARVVVVDNFSRLCNLFHFEFEKKGKKKSLVLLTFLLLAIIELFVVFIGVNYQQDCVFFPFQVASYCQISCHKYWQVVKWQPTKSQFSTSLVSAINLITENRFLRIMTAMEFITMKLKAHTHRHTKEKCSFSISVTNWSNIFNTLYSEEEREREFEMKERGN